MRNWNIALGYYQNESTANAVIEELRRKGFWRVASVHHRQDGTLTIRKLYPIQLIFWLILIIAMVAATATYFWPLMGHFFVAGAALIALITCFWSSSIDSQLLDRFKGRVSIDEILVIAKVSPVVPAKFSIFCAM